MRRRESIDLETQTPEEIRVATEVRSVPKNALPIGQLEFVSEQGNFLTIQEAMERTGLKRATISAAIRRQELPVQPYRWRGKGYSGGQFLLTEADLFAWVATRDQERAVKNYELAQKREAEARALQASSRPPKAGQRTSQEWAALLCRTRQREGLTRAQLARGAGLDSSYITVMEQGLIPKRAKVLALAQALGVDPDPLLAVCGYALEKATLPLELTQWLASLTPAQQTKVMEQGPLPKTDPGLPSPLAKLLSSLTQEERWQAYEVLRSWRGTPALAANRGCKPKPQKISATCGQSHKVLTNWLH